MTLAIILLFGISLTASAPLLAGGATSGQSATQPPQSQGSQSSAQSPPPETKPPATSPAKTSSQGHPPSKHPQHKKKVPVNCVTAPAAAKPGVATSDPASTTPPAAGAGTSTPSATNSSTPTNCPPAKIIVRQGGTEEPSIQLEGGAGGDQARQRDTANQMLGATEQNLKKLSGVQLSQDQQGMVTQVHQFMEQSKTAAAAGDLERARTLAWKAQLLSEELITPQK